MADAVEKPVRRRPSFRRVRSGAASASTSAATPAASTREHKAAQSSGSGAGAWLARGHARGESGGKRTYHIPAAAGVVGIDAQSLAYHAASSAGHSGRSVLPSKSSDDVDLDLSIDFVSHLESRRTNERLVTAPASPIRQGDDDYDKENAIPSSTSTPRGMSSAAWHARQRKKPPTPLSLGRKMQGSQDITSLFNPESPTKRGTTGDFDEQPLTLVPLAKSRRAAQSGISPNTADENALGDVALLINSQRSAKRQEQQQTTESPSKRTRKDGASPTKRVLRPLGENKAMTNAQVERQSDVFIVGGQEEKRHSVADQRASVQSTSSSAAGTLSVSLGHAHGVRALRSRQQSAQESEESHQSAPQSFKTTMTSKTSANGHSSSQGHSHHMSPSAENVLGLLFPAQHVGEIAHPAVIDTIPEGVVVTECSPVFSQTDTTASPLGSQASPLFSENGGGSSTAAGGGSWTPATAKSALFGDVPELSHSTDGKLSLPASSAMIRGGTAPASNVAGEVIREESIASIERSSSLPSLEVAVRRDGAAQRERSTTEQSAACMTEESSVVSKHEMIVSTMSSPTRQEKRSLDLTDVTGTSSAGAKKGPWSQSPLLLDGGIMASKGEAQAVGLGLSFDSDASATKQVGSAGKRSSRHMELDMSQVDVIVQRAEVANEGTGLGLMMDDEGSDLGTTPLYAKSLMPPPRQQQQKTQARRVRASPSNASSVVESFAINVTPPAPTANYSEDGGQPDHRVEVPMNVTEDDLRLSRDGRARWSSKLWSMTSTFRSPAATDAQTTSPPMRTLTLVRKQQLQEGGAGSDDVQRANSRQSHHRSRSRNDDGSVAVPAGSNDDDGYHSVPVSTVVGAQSTFQSAIAAEGASVARPAQAAAGSVEARSSKHVHRPSSTMRLRYVKEGSNSKQHVQVNMDGDGEVDDVRSPRTADSPSGMTPRFDHLTGGASAAASKQQHRRSWTAVNGAMVSASPSPVVGASSPWLAPKRQSLIGARDSELYSLAANVQALLQQAEGADEDAAAVEAILLGGDGAAEEGLRRRANHRSANSLPTTPTFVTDAWPAADDDNEVGMASLEPVRRGPSVMFHPNAATADRDSDAEMRQMDGRQSRMDVHSSSHPLHDRFDDQGPSYPYLYSRRTSKAAAPPVWNTRRVSGLFTDHYDGGGNVDIGLLAYSGRALQDVKASQALFFAGFLFMPWLWFVGGWALDESGLMHIEHEDGYGGSSYGSHKANRNTQRSTWFGGERDFGADVDRPASKRWSAAAARVRQTMLGGAVKRREAEAKANHRSEHESFVVQMARHAVHDWRSLDSYVVCNRVMAIVATFVVLSGFSLAIAAVAVHY